MPSIDTSVNINNNFLSPVGFKFQLLKLPVFEFFVQGIQFSDITMADNPGQVTPFLRVPLPGSAISFGDIVIDYKLDEYMNNYTELYDWMHGIGRVDSYTSYANLVSQPFGQGVEPDATLTFLDSSMDPSINFYFSGIFPVHLGGFKMDTRDADITYITSTVTFRYGYFEYEILKTPS